MLDLACGAGAVACVARDAERGFDVTGVDFATEIKSIDGVKLVLGAPLEALPLPDAGFDVVVSQYGFEYADVEPASRELARVLAPGGAVALVVHAREGAPVQDIAGRLARARRMLAPGRFADVVLRLADALMAGAPTESLAAEAEAARAVEAKAEHDGTTRACWRY
ncbi:MAG: methyltransferase domain-containing protein [Hyphomonadaceae bacterium]|nr:methyltransferase domain-containing protein [Hyphomonadaceae bacterium]